MRFMKYILDKILNKLGYNITKIKPAPAPSNPIDILSILLDKWLLSNSPQDGMWRNFFFIQIGANDGVRWDPIHKYVKKFNLAGVLVEPLPDMFQELVSNYDGYDNLIFENCAISNTSGECTIYRAKRDAPVKDWVHGIASFNKAHVMQRVSPAWLEESIVPTITPRELIDKYNIEKIDLLQVDTEGFDYQIVKLFLEAEFFPKIINYENVNLSEIDKIKCKSLLYDCGYKYIDVGIDTIAMRE